MPLHPKLYLLLGLQKLTKQQLVDTQLPAAEARAKTHAQVAKSKNLVDFAPEEMFRVSEQTAPAADGYQIPLRLYYPTPEAQLPVLMFYHGGGFVIGDLDMYDRTCRRLARMARCLVVSVDYRLAPEYPFPTAPEDCFAALNWVYAHADTLGADRHRIAVAGDSAGGNLAAVMCLMARDRRIEAKICAQILIYPTIDATRSAPSITRNGKGYFLTAAQMAWFHENYIPAGTDLRTPYLSPYFADLQGLPPTYLCTAEFDPLHDEGEMYANRLREAGVEVMYQDYRGMIHAFFTMPKFLKAAQTAQWQAAEFLKKYFEHK